MLLVPGTACPQHLCRVTLVVDDRPEVIARIALVCARRRGTIVALAFERGLPDNTAHVDMMIEVPPRYATLLEQRLAQLIDVREIRSQR